MGGKKIQINVYNLLQRYQVSYVIVWYTFIQIVNNKKNVLRYKNQVAKVIKVSKYKQKIKFYLALPYPLFFSNLCVTAKQLVRPQDLIRQVTVFRHVLVANTASYLIQLHSSNKNLRKKDCTEYKSFWTALVLGAYHQIFSIV